MKRRFLVSIVLAVLGEVWATTTVVAQHALQFTIQQSQRALEVPGCYVGAERVPVQIAVTNRSSEPRDVLLKVHNQDGYARAFPEGLQARLVSEGGVILTKHSNPPDIGGDGEWWTGDFLRSTVCFGQECEMPGDRVTLRPGETVRRVADLSSVIDGAPLIRQPLTPGKYSLRFRLGNLVSNDFAFLISASRTCDSQRAP